MDCPWTVQVPGFSWEINPGFRGSFLWLLGRIGGFVYLALKGAEASGLLVAMGLSAPALSGCDPLVRGISVCR